MNTPAAPPLRRHPAQLVALAAVFVGPLVLAFVLYYGGHYAAAGRLNGGELIEPPRPLPRVAAALADGGSTGPDFLRHGWSLVVLDRPGCARPCQDALAVTLSVQRALASEAPRVQRVLLLDAACCERAWRAAGAGLVTAVANGADGRRLLDAFSGAGAALEPGRIWLVDPLGNLLMSYPAATGPKVVLRDLERLLRLSRIG